MDKFNRNYELVITLETLETITIRPPFTVEFDIVRSILSSTNVCQLRIYNLAAVNRNRLRFNISNYGTYRRVSFKAGYGDNLAEVFRGNITQAWSVREGVDWITQIECLDGGFAYINGVADIPAVAGTPGSSIIGELINRLPNVTLGAVGSFNEPLVRGNTYSGNPIDILSGDLTNGGFFIDKEKAYCLKTNEYVTSRGERPIIVDTRSGLLGTPTLEETIVRLEMLFEPQLDIGRSAQLDSITGENFNGLYKITEVSHRGVISGAVSGTAVTTAGFFYDKLEGLSPVFI